MRAKKLHLFPHKAQIHTLQKQTCSVFMALTLHGGGDQENNGPPSLSLQEGPPTPSACPECWGSAGVQGFCCGPGQSTGRLDVEAPQPTCHLPAPLPHNLPAPLSAGHPGPTFPALRLTSGPPFPVSLFPGQQLRCCQPAVYLPPGKQLT